MTPLGRLLARRIAAEGPLSIAEVMAQALAHEAHGYYQVQEPFGSAGDFITAPEISQMFGEVLGLWLGAVWQSMGSPARAILGELGPGRGTLMADARRALAHVPGFPLAAPVHLVETSPRLRRIQAETIKAPVIHHDAIDSLPVDAPLLLLANEFFDALPIRQAVFADGGFHERMVGLDGEDRLTFGLAPEALAPGLLPPHEIAEAGAVLEWSPASIAIAAELGRRLAAQGGVLLAIDYGAAHRGFADTLQAVSRHRYADVLSTLGEADLTAHVNFAHLAAAATAQGATAFGPLTQGALLRGLGIDLRAQRLAAAHPEAAERVLAAHRRLTASDQMGSLFKALALTGAATPPPPLFDAIR
ncbi:class I SAM-dependent methyltransferase [Zavarzinia aquatilis]|uniref:Methyltransferase n=1 Tax=Zavarzinia aquatilis TaxID=2211142 RepID=A0A317EH34_9PROT|nr:SAM-dependent methyltransferase [Zavarzinia aquatilis]PWR25624.1 methyltransferase [Zavarzinia aquatilis]